MILDDKLIEISNIIIQTLKTDLLMFQYQSNRVVISSLNRSYTVLLKIIVDRNDLTDYPEVPSIYFLPVEGHTFWDSPADIRLVLENYRRFNNTDLDKREYNSLTKLNKNLLRDKKDYRYYPAVLFTNKIAESDYGDNTRCIDFKYNNFKSTISCSLLKEILVNPIHRGMEFKLFDNPSPLLFKYTTEFYDLPAVITGAVAPRWHTTGDYTIRL